MVPRLHGVVALALGTSLAASLNLNVVDLFSGPDAPLHHPVLVAPRASTTPTEHRATSRRTTTGIRPEQYGAVPNDGHSDYKALQRAIDAAARRGVPVRLSANSRYDSNHWLRLHSHSTLVGAGPSSELKFHWRKNNNSNDGCYVCNWDQTTGNRDITVARLHIVGAASGEPAGLSAMNPVPNTPAIRFRLVHGLRIRHVEISRAPGISMLVQGSRGVRIVDNHVHNSGRDGINIGWYKVDSRRVLVKGNLIQRVGDDGVAIIGAPPTRHEPKGVQFRVVHNRILGWKVDPNGLQLGRGISVLGARRVLIKHDRIRDPDSAGILISPSSRPDRFNHHAPWKSKRVRVVHNDVGSIDSTGLLIKNSVRIHWGLNVFSNVRPTVKVFTCRLCSRL